MAELYLDEARNASLINPVIYCRINLSRAAVCMNYNWNRWSHESGNGLSLEGKPGWAAKRT